MFCMRILVAVFSQKNSCFVRKLYDDSIICAHSVWPYRFVISVQAVLAYRKCGKIALFTFALDLSVYCCLLCAGCVGISGSWHSNLSYLHHKSSWRAEAWTNTDIPVLVSMNSFIMLCYTIFYVYFDFKVPLSSLSLGSELILLLFVQNHVGIFTFRKKSWWFLLDCFVEDLKFKTCHFWHGSFLHALRIPHTW